MPYALHRLIETRFTTALELALLPLIDLDRYAKKRPKDSPGQQTFRWVTIGAEEGPDGEKHGGHPVLIDNDGRMQSGKFAGQTFDQAFGDKAKSLGETESKPQESPPAPPQESLSKPPEATQAESKPVEPPPGPAQPPAPETKAPEPPQAASTANEGIELPSGPDTTPRDRASAADQANQQQYAGARASAVSNIGEDIMGSARHRALLWRGLEAAEQDGSAAEAITRDQLLKHEPHSLMTSVDTNPLASLAMYYALRKFPAKPGTRSSASPETLAKDRKQFYQAYVDIKNFAEQIARETPDHDAMRSISELNQFVVSRIEQLRREDRYNQTANDLITLHKALRGGYHSQKSGVISQLNEFAKALTNLPRDESDEDEADASVTRSQYAQAATYAAKIIDGESLNSAFGKTSTASTPRFNPADSYVKVAERQGGKDLQGVTKSPQAALEYAVEQLKLRGVQWGNYVTDEERMHHAAKSVEALVDLADVLGIKPEDISLGGQLGLAIGARGTGNALAHYEPELKVINLTRAGGVGSLAHEWGHALDHSLTDFSKGFMSDEYRFTHQSVQNGRVWRMEEKDATASSRLNPEELSNIEIRRAYRAFFESPEYQQYYRRVREHVQDLVRNKQVSLKKANEYWLSRKEIFARTFERYVQRKLETSGRKNTYLAGIEKNAYQQGGLWPTDQEADSLMAGMDGIFSAFRQSRYGSTDRQQYSRRSARAIIERMLTTEFILERYTAKKNETEGLRWVTIGSDTGGDGKRHGGHPVLIDQEGRMHSGPFAGKTFGEAFNKADAEETPQPKSKASESFLSAGEAIKAGHSFAQWQDPISRAFVEERIDGDHPAFQSIDPSQSPSIDDYNHSRSLFGQHVLTSLGHFGRVVDVAPDAKSLIIEHEGGQRSSHLPSGLSHLGAEIRHRVNKGHSIDRHIEYLAKQLALEMGRDQSSFQDLFAKYHLPPDHLDLKRRITSELEKSRQQQRFDQPGLFGEVFAAPAKPVDHSFGDSRDSRKKQKAFLTGLDLPAGQQDFLDREDGIDLFRAEFPTRYSEKWITIGGKPNPDKGTRHSGGKAVLIDEDGVIQGGNVPKHWQGKHVTSAHKPSPPPSLPTSLPDFIDPDDIDDDDRQTSTDDDDDISFDPEDFDSAISFDPSKFEDSTTSTGAMPASDFIGNPRLKSRFDEMGLSIDQLNQRLGLNIQPQQPSKPSPDLNPHTFDAAAHSTITPMAFEITSNPRIQNRFKDLTLEEFNRRMGLSVQRPEVAPDSISFVPPEPPTQPDAPEPGETTPAARATKPSGPFRPRNRVDHAIVDTVGDDPERVADFRNILDNVYQLRLQRDEARRDAIRSLFSSYGISSQRIGSLISLLGRQDYDKIPRWGEMVRTARSSPQYAVLFDHAGGESDKRDDDESKLAASIAEGFSVTPPKYSPEIVDAAKELARSQGFFQTSIPAFPESSSWDSSIPDYFSAQRSRFRRAIIERYFDYVELLRAS
jgi:hypothetical protein